VALPYARLVDLCLCSHLGNIQGVLDLLSNGFDITAPVRATLGRPTPRLPSNENRSASLGHRPASMFWHLCLPTPEQFFHCERVPVSCPCAEVKYLAGYVAGRMQVLSTCGDSTGAKLAAAGRHSQWRTSNRRTTTHCSDQPSTNRLLAMRSERRTSCLMRGDRSHQQSADAVH
jgi:hypothetical protein